MPRVKRGVVANRRHKKILKQEIMLVVLQYLFYLEFILIILIQKNGIQNQILLLKIYSKLLKS